MSEPSGLVLAFDIGGTWFRSAFVSEDGRIDEQARVPAMSRSRFESASIDELQAMLVAYLVNETSRLRARARFSCVGVSLGAAVDGRTGLVIGASPLWGPTQRLAFDIRAELQQRLPDYAWTIVNDLTAAALGLAELARDAGVRRLAVVTVSSGIAMRTIEPSTLRVAVSELSGLQGEIGHLPADCFLDGRRLAMACDCGAANHLSAFSSGRGIARIVQQIAAASSEWLGGDGSPVERFALQVHGGHPEAIAVLNAVTEPLARALLSVLTVDAEIGRVYITGGVAHGLGDAYMNSLVRHMAQFGLYGSDLNVADDFGSIVLLAPSPSPTLHGAALAARASTSDGLRADATTTWTVRATHSSRYDIALCDDVLDPSNPALRAAARMLEPSGLPRLVVADRVVWQHYGAAIDAYTRAAGVETKVVLLQANENSKTLDLVLQVIDACSAIGLLRRATPVIGFGGGAILDIVGLAASLYRRGVPYVRVPTTLVGMIDAGIGIKTGVNFSGKKSLVGSYHPPEAVLVDPSFLSTLDERDMSNGLAEALKIALVSDRSLFDLIERAPEGLRDAGTRNAAQRALIAGSISAMLAELVDNLWECKLERLADFGHSFSPAIEMAATCRLAHGEAVALDVALCVRLSVRRGLLDAEAAARIFRTMSRLGLAVFDEVMTPALLWSALEDACRHRDGLQRVPLLTDIGQATFANDLTWAEIDAALDDLRVSWGS